MAYKKDNEIIELRMSQLVVTGKVWDNKKIKYFKFIEKKSTRNYFYMVDSNWQQFNQSLNFFCSQFEFI